jgi:hypothetical protein
MTRHKKELKKSLGHSCPDQRWGHLGRAIGGRGPGELVGIAAERMYLRRFLHQRRRRLTCRFSADATS